jgi:hypothetical protein
MIRFSPGVNAPARMSPRVWPSSSSTSETMPGISVANVAGPASAGGGGGAFSTTSTAPRHAAYMLRRAFRSDSTASARLGAVTTAESDGQNPPISFGTRP